MKIWSFRKFTALVLIFAILLFTPLAVDAGGGGGGSFFSAVIMAAAIAAVTWGVGALALSIAQSIAPVWTAAITEAAVGFAGSMAGAIGVSVETLGYAITAASFVNDVRSNLEEEKKDAEQDAQARADAERNAANQPAEVSSAFVQPTLQRGFTLQGGQGGQSGGGSCPSGYQVCGSVCLQMPEDGVCCASVGYEDRYCPSNAICRTDGQCESASGGSCSGSRGEVCQSEENSCGMTNQARKVCDGSCPAGIPDDGECAPPTITFTSEPRFLDPNEVCTLRWSTQNATSCRITGPGVDASGTSGSTDVVTTQTTEYTATCKNGRIVERSLSVNCQLTPDFNNI